MKKPSGTSEPSPLAVENDVPHHRSARQIFTRGLAITLPSILTLVIVLWIGGLVYDYLIYPVSTLVRFAVAEVIETSVPRSSLARHDRLPPLDFVDRHYLLSREKSAELEKRGAERGVADPIKSNGEIPWDWVAGADERFAGIYVPMGKRAVPYWDYAEVATYLPRSRMPNSVTGLYMELVTLRYFGSTFTLSTIAVLLTVLAIYFVGRLVRIRLGEYLVTRFETDVLGRLPLISNVYGSMKQVTDFVFTERKVEYNRVVTIEYPRRGIWSIGFVTGSGMDRAANAAGEPLVNVLVPTSPMPVTGYTMSVPRSQVVDLDISLDQAFQFIISCGVLVPPHQMSESEQREFLKSTVEAGPRSIESTSPSL